MARPLSFGSTYLNETHLSWYAYSRGFFFLWSGEGWLHWFGSYKNLFGPLVDDDWINKISIDPSSNNEWIWWPCSLKATIAHAIYDHLNGNMIGQTSLKGWHYIWKLRSIPKVKLFIWKMGHGKLPTGSYLYNIMWVIPQTALFVVWKLKLHNTLFVLMLKLDSAGLTPFNLLA